MITHRKELVCGGIGKVRFDPLREGYPDVEAL
jgi:hypothetical protein